MMGHGEKNKVAKPDLKYRRVEVAAIKSVLRAEAASWSVQRAKEAS